MKKLFIAMAILFCCTEAMAGSTQTEGQGVRPISMGGAFIAVADGPEAIFYNPAGLTQIKGTEVSIGALSINPKNEYTHGSNGVENESDQSAIAPYAFLSSDSVSPVYFGIGMYAPFAREADYNADSVGGFGNLYALSIRKDYSPVVAYKINERLSIGAGFIAAQGQTKQTIQVAYGSGIYVIDELEGWGFSGLLGALYKVTEQLKIGGVYRGRMDMIQKGEREQTGWTAPRDATVSLAYPATAGIGLAYMPNEKLTLACDIDWNDWSYLYEAVTRIAQDTADSTTTVDAHDTVDYRFGLEFRPDKTLALRGGFMYLPAATPSRYILPQKPDFDLRYVTFGMSKAWKDWKCGLVYEYTWSNKWDVTDNVYSYNGRYEVQLHTVGLEIKYTF